MGGAPIGFCHSIISPTLVDVSLDLASEDLMGFTNSD